MVKRGYKGITDRGGPENLGPHSGKGPDDLSTELLQGRRSRGSSRSSDGDRTFRSPGDVSDGFQS